MNTNNNTIWDLLDVVSMQCLYTSSSSSSVTAASENNNKWKLPVHNTMFIVYNDDVGWLNWTLGLWKNKHISSHVYESVVIIILRNTLYPYVTSWIIASCRFFRRFMLRNCLNFIAEFKHRELEAVWGMQKVITRVELWYERSFDEYYCERKSI